MKVKSSDKFAVRGFFILFTAVFLISGCGKEITVDRETAEKVCNEAHIAAQSGNLDALKNVVMEKYKIKGRIRVKEEGIYIPLKRFNVVEDGLFVPLKEEKYLINSGDPSYKKATECLYIYHISG